jgi:hypothetical protein
MVNAAARFMVAAKMTKLATLARVARFDLNKKRLVAKAGAALTAASIAVALLPFRRAIALGGRPVGKPRDSATVADIVWAVEAWSRRMPWRTKCIEQGIAAQRLLRSAGFDARLHYGARHAGAKAALEAHVWVTIDGKPVIGGEEARDFAEIASYP